MTPGVRKTVLAAHLVFSDGWVGAVLAYLALGFVAVNTDDDTTIRAAWTAMEAVGWYVAVPLALASLVTGLVMALGTRWGLFRHYWVLISFILTVFAAVVLVFHMPSVSATVDAAQSTEGEALEVLGGDLLHPAIGLVVLLVVHVLNVFKPQGMTHYGRRRARLASAPDRSRSPLHGS